MFAATILSCLYFVKHAEVESNEFFHHLAHDIVDACRIEQIDYLKEHRYSDTLIVFSECDGMIISSGHYHGFYGLVHVTEWHIPLDVWYDNYLFYYPKGKLIYVYAIDRVTPIDVAVVNGYGINIEEIAHLAAEQGIIIPDLSAGLNVGAKRWRDWGYGD